MPKDITIDLATYNRLCEENQRMRAEIEKEIGWLTHIRPQITAPEPVMYGFDQAIKYLRAALTEKG